MDRQVDISDPIRILTYKFLGGADLPYQDAADFNDDGQVDISDAVFGLNLLFVDNTKKIPPPNIKEIEGRLVMDSAQGIDTTGDDLPPCRGFDFEIKQ